MWDKLDASQTPNLDTFRGYIKTPLFTELLEHIEKNYKVTPKFFYSGCGMRPGWNMKLQKSGWSLCTIYPEIDAFAVLVAIKESNWTEAETILGGCCKYTQDLYKAAPPYIASKWLTFEVTSRDIFFDLLKFVEIRAKDKKVRVSP